MGEAGAADKADIIRNGIGEDHGHTGFIAALLLGGFIDHVGIGTVDGGDDVQLAALANADAVAGIGDLYHDGLVLAGDGNAQEAVRGFDFIQRAAGSGAEAFADHVIRGRVEAGTVDFDVTVGNTIDLSGFRKGGNCCQKGQGKEQGNDFLGHTVKSSGSCSRTYSYI